MQFSNLRMYFVLKISEFSVWVAEMLVLCKLLRDFCLKTASDLSLCLCLYLSVEITLNIIII